MTVTQIHAFIGRPVPARSSKWQMAGRVDLFAVEPEFATGIARELPVRVFKLTRGPLPAPGAGERGLNAPFLVLEGVVVRNVWVCGRKTAELIGPGDLVRFGSYAELAMLPMQESWSVLERALLAELGSPPDRWQGSTQISASAMIARATASADRLALQRSICAHVRVDLRVLGYLWYLADRFGVVTLDGIRLTVPLTHSLLAELIGARRPTVTTALQKLVENGHLVRDGRGFLLQGAPTVVEELAHSAA